MATEERHKIADKILKLLEKPGDWHVENYPCGRTFTLRHNKKETSLWMCSGFHFFYLRSPFEVKFPFWKKMALWKIAKPLFEELSKDKKVNIEELTLKHLNKK